MPNHKCIAIYLNHPTCSVDSVNGVLSALSTSYRVKIFTKQKVQEGFFDDVEMVVFPGGTGQASAFSAQMKVNLKEIQQFMSRGGKYLGICMGAYWADEYFFGFLKDTRVVQYIKQPKATVKSSFSTVTSVEWEGQPQNMYFYDGPTFVGGQFKQVATYANGNPMAIVQGQVGLIGCHLESEAYWYTKKVIRPFWHQGDHHQLLLKFVNDFLNSDPQLKLF
jgi:hypothetical protein